MALITQGLSGIGTDLDRAIAIHHFGQTQLAHGNRLHLAAIEKRERRSHDSLCRSGCAHGGFWFFQGLALFVRPMAGEAGDYGIAGQGAVFQRPRARGIDRLYKITNRPGEMHSVASQAVVHEQICAVELGIQKNLPIRTTVRSGLPTDVLLLVTSSTIRHDFGNVSLPEMNPVRHSPTQMGENAPHVIEVKSGIESEEVSVALRARDVAVRRGVPVGIWLPYLVAPRASSATGSLVIETGSREPQEQRCDDDERPIPTN